MSVVIFLARVLFIHILHTHTQKSTENKKIKFLEKVKNIKNIPIKSKICLNTLGPFLSRTSHIYNVTFTDYTGSF